MSAATATFVGQHNTEDKKTIEVTGEGITSEVTVQPTEEQEGVRTYTASIASVEFATVGEAPFTGTATEAIPKLPHTHLMTAHPAVAPTCTTAGNSAYWSCEECGKFFSDEAGTTEVEEDSWVIPAKGHSYGELVAEVPATCTADGMKAHYQCSVCEKYFDADKAETTEAALKIPATGHKLVNVPAVAATCTTPGNTEYWNCERCGAVFGDSIGTAIIQPDSWIIPATGHKPAEAVIENEIAATCTEGGSYD